MKIFIILVLLMKMAMSFSWPNKISELDNGKNIQLVKGKRCPTCYSIQFSDSFGLNDSKELEILVNLHKKRVDMEYDLDGSLFDDKDALDHLYNLAINFKSKEAAKILLFPIKYGMKLGVGTLEEFEGEYTIPLLSNFKKLEEVIEENEYQKIAQNIAHWASFHDDSSNVENLIHILDTKKFYLLKENIVYELKSILKVDK